MNDKAIILVGAGGHCRACVDVVEQEGRFEIAGLVEQPGATHPAPVLGYPVIGTDDHLGRLREKYAHALVTVGQIRSPDTRARLFEQLEASGFELPVIISPLAYVSRHARVGRGSIVMHNALVNAGADVGSNVIVNTRALVEHDVVVGDHCHIATGAIVNGGARVGERTFVGSGAVIFNGVTIGRNCVVGAGAKVTVSLGDGARLV